MIESIEMFNTQYNGILCPSVYDSLWEAWHDIAIFAWALRLIRPVYGRSTREAISQHI